MISEIDKSSVVDETESAKVTTESQMAVFHRVDAATGNDRRPMDSSRYAGMSNWCDVDERIGCECDDQAGQQHEPADPGMAEPDHAALGTP